MSDPSSSETPLRTTFKIKLNGDTLAIATVGQAYHIAFASHEGQHRDTGQPFIIHPIAVALLPF